MGQGDVPAWMGGLSLDFAVDEGILTQGKRGCRLAWMETCKALRGSGLGKPGQWVWIEMIIITSRI